MHIAIKISKTGQSQALNIRRHYVKKYKPYVHTHLAIATDVTKKGGKIIKQAGPHKQDVPNQADV